MKLTVLKPIKEIFLWSVGGVSNLAQMRTNTNTRGLIVPNLLNRARHSKELKRVLLGRRVCGGDARSGVCTDRDVGRGQREATWWRRPPARSRPSRRVVGFAALRDLGVFRWRSVIELSERISNDSSDDSSCGPCGW